MTALYWLLMAMAVGSVAPAGAQQTSTAWAMGRWSGSLESFAGAGSPVRVLNVTNVDANGNAEATFGPSGGAKHKVLARLEGNRITLVTQTQVGVQLSRTTEDALVGSLTANVGESLGLTMTRIRKAPVLDDRRLEKLIINAGMVPYRKFERPEDFAFADVKTGQKLSLLGDLEDNVVLINIWATWCPPCVKEMPALKELHQALERKGLVVLGVNYERRAVQQPFIEVHRLTFPCVAGNVDSLSFVGHRWFPQTYLVDRGGRIVAYKRGAHNLGDAGRPSSRQLSVGRR